MTNVSNVSCGDIRETCMCIDLLVDWSAAARQSLERDLFHWDDFNIEFGIHKNKSGTSAFSYTKCRFGGVLFRL